MGVSLIEGEEILKQTTPHPLSMIFLFAVSLYIGCLGGLGIAFQEDVLHWLRSYSLGPGASWTAYWAIWSLTLVLPALAVSFFRINWYWLLLAVVLCGAGIALHVWRHEIFTACDSLLRTHAQRVWPISESADYIISRNLPNYWLILAALVGLFLSNGFRSSHKYYITSRRIITRFGFFMVRERDLLYSKIDDLVIHQNLLGRLFNFGTLIPISASGLGTGSDHAIVSAGAEQKLPVGPAIKVTVGGGRSITIPRAPSFYSLYGVSRPNSLKNLLIEEMDKREYGYTRRKKQGEK